MKDHINDLRNEAGPFRAELDPTQKESKVSRRGMPLLYNPTYPPLPMSSWPTAGKSKSHISILKNVNHLARLYTGQGLLEEAESMCERALQGYESVVGADHVSILETVNHLGHLYTHRGRLDEAESMCERALRGFDKVLGADHISTLSAVNNLGHLYTGQGRLKEAEATYERALRGYEKALGHHTSTLETVNNLGLLYTGQGRLKEAEAMYERALRGYERVLGADHISILETFSNMGYLYTQQRRPDKAEAMCERALRGYEKVLGADHISTLSAANNLGHLYTGQGRLKEGEAMYERVLLGYEKALGANHILTLNTVKNLGRLYIHQERLDKAEAMCERALRGIEKALGADNISTLGAVNNLGFLYTVQGRLDAAEAMCERALRGYEKALGADHISTLDAVNNLGVIYAKQGLQGKAEDMYQRALQGRNRVLRANNTPTLPCRFDGCDKVYIRSEARLSHERRHHTGTLPEIEKEYNSVLVDASSRGLIESVKLLLENDADINTQDGEYSTELREASTKGHELIVRLLLEKGADVSAPGESCGSALHAASYGGHENIVKLLLDTGADVNAQDGEYGSALQSASYSGHENIVKLLLERNANVNAQGGYYNNALQAASAKGQEQAVKALVEHNADVNLQGGYYGSALQAASHIGHKQIVKLLLDKGANVKVQGGKYGSAFQSAVAGGHEEISNLLERAADVETLQASSTQDHEQIQSPLLDQKLAQAIQYGLIIHSTPSSPLISGSEDRSSSSVSDDTSFDNKYDVIEELMDYFYSVFGIQCSNYVETLQAFGDPIVDSRLSGVSCPLSSNAGSTRSRVPSTQGAQSSVDNPRIQGQNGRGKRSRDNDGQEDDDNARKRVPIDPRDCDLGEHRKSMLACHFLQRNPNAAKRTCIGPGPGWETIHRLKEHIYKKHALPPTCPRCCESFSLESSLENHWRALVPCQVQNKAKVEGISKSQEAQLRSKKRGLLGDTEADKWREIYLILFPDTDYADIPSPYFHVPGTSSAPPSFGAYVQGNLPRLVRQYFESQLEIEMGPISDRLKEQMKEVVLRFTKKLAEDYDKLVADPSLMQTRYSATPILTPGDVSEPSPNSGPQTVQPSIHDSQDLTQSDQFTIEPLDNHDRSDLWWTSHAAQEVLTSTTSMDSFDTFISWPQMASSTSELDDWCNLGSTATQTGSSSTSSGHSVPQRDELVEFTGMMSDIPSATSDEDKICIEIDYARKGKGRAGK